MVQGAGCTPLATSPRVLSAAAAASQRARELGQHKGPYFVLHRQGHVHVAQGQHAEGEGHPRRPQVVHVPHHALGGDHAVGRPRQQLHRHIQQAVVLW